MDTQNSAVAEIPNFKLAKVGKDRDRKRAGASWLSGARGGGSGFTGAVGGTGGAGAAGMGLAKTLVALVVTASLGTGAWQFGRSFSDGAGRAKPAVKKVFGEKDNAQQYADTSNVIKTESSIPNSMGYVSGSLDGMTPEERAKKQAEEEAARAAQEAADKKAADEEAKKAAAPDPASNAAPVDPATIASAQGGAKKGLGDGKFGKLGNSFGGGGGGLSGGAGLSGGINRNFGGASAINTKPKVNAGSMSAFRNASKPGYSTGGHALAGRSGAKGFAKRQLDNAFTQSRQAMAAGKSENASAGAASAFDNNSGVGSVIEGPGVGAGAKLGTADGGANPMASNTGGPVGGSDAPCAQGMAPDINGNCQTIKTNHSKDGANYQWMIDAVKGLMAALTIIALLTLIYDKSPYFWGIAAYLRVIIGVIGAAICGLGIMIMGASGDNTMGGIIAAVGAFVLANTIWPDTLGMGSTVLTQVSVGPMIAGVVGMMAAANVKQPGGMQ